MSAGLRTGFAALRALSSVTRATPSVSSKIFNRSPSLLLRNSGTWSYREPPPPPARVNLLWAEFMGGVFWWWVLWHFWHESEMITGEWPEVFPETWTDEELGIPPDEEGISGRLEN